MNKTIKLAEPFDLSQVRLLDGICKRNQDLDEKYLLSLDPDRLLHSFQVAVQLPSTAQPLGGWENPESGIRGHFTGHYLSACAEMYAATGNQILKDRGTYIVTELGKCQEVWGNGYLSTLSPDVFDRLEAFKFKEVNVPYYSIHKIMAGLLDQHHYSGNLQALEIVCKMADYFRNRMVRLTPDQIERMLLTNTRHPRNEYGGMSEVLHNLYAITKKPEYLAFAEVFQRGWFLDPLSQNQDILEGLHANTHIPQVIGFARHYELTGDERYRRAADYFWSQVTQHHSYVTGSNSKREHFLAPGVEANELSNDTGETCNVYNMLKLTQHIFSWKANPAVADYSELALYNHIIGSIDPDTGMTTYFIALKPGHFKSYGTPDSAFWCCTGTGVENHATYGSFIYYNNADTLWVNLFIPSRLTWQEKGLAVTQTTRFPKSDWTTLTFAAASPTRLKLLLRVPSWTTLGSTVKINGKNQNVAALPGSYVTLDRTWQNGDKIEFHVPMKLRLQRAGDNPNMVAIMYGPIVMAGALGHEGMPDNDNDANREAFMNVPTPEVPDLSGDSGNLDFWIKPVADKPLAFMVKAGKPNDVRLLPFYEIHHERYTVYWNFVDTAVVKSA